jgi:hypothetical protein
VKPREQGLQALLAVAQLGQAGVRGEEDVAERAHGRGLGSVVVTPAAATHPGSVRRGQHDLGEEGRPVAVVGRQVAGQVERVGEEGEFVRWGGGRGGGGWGEEAGERGGRSRERAAAPVFFVWWRGRVRQRVCGLYIFL